MAPVPEDNQDKPSNGNKDDPDTLTGNLSNPNLMMPLDASDSSDDDDNDVDYTNEFGVPSGYTLLPQEPGEVDDSDSDNDYYSTQNTGDINHMTSTSTDSTETNVEGLSAEMLPETVLSSEAGASAPTQSLSSDSCHPAFLAKFPDGKVPSYMQVPSLPKDKSGNLWNQKRRDTSQVSIDSAQESKILKAMSGFSLPKESIPDWAKNLQEEQWQQQVLQHIGKSSDGTKHSTDPKKKQQLSGDGGHNEISSCKSDNWVAEFPEASTGQK